MIKDEKSSTPIPVKMTKKLKFWTHKVLQNNLIPQQSYQTWQQWLGILISDRIVV